MKHGPWCHCGACTEKANLLAEIDFLRSELTARELEVDRLQTLLIIAVSGLACTPELYGRGES
jgi:hypothetical protein